MQVPLTSSDPKGKISVPTHFLLIGSFCLFGPLRPHKCPLRIAKITTKQ